MHNLTGLAHASAKEENLSIRKDLDAWLCGLNMDANITDMNVRRSKLVSEFMSAPHIDTMLHGASTDCWLVQDLEKLSNRPSHPLTLVNVCVRMLLLKDFALAAWFDDDGKYAEVPISHNQLVLRALCQLFAPVTVQAEHFLIQELSPKFHPLFNAEMRLRNLLPGAVFTHLSEDVVYLYVMEVLKRLTSKSTQRVLVSCFESYEETGDGKSCITACATLCKDACPELALIHPKILDIYMRVLLTDVKI
jgi:hypothetical protein